MAGTIVVDRLESDASYASSINIASPIVISNTITGNVNIDNGTLFVNQINNRVGINTITPNSAIEIRVTDGTYQQNTTSFLTINNPSAVHQSSIDFVGNNIMKGRIRSDYVGNMNYTANTDPTNSFSGHAFFTGGGDSGLGNVNFSIMSTGSFRAVIPSFVKTTWEQPAFFVRAWCNHTGTGSGTTLNGSGNISSVTKSGTGQFTYNFTTAMPDANYAVQVNSWQAVSTTGVSYNVYNLTTSNFFVNSAENNVNANPNTLYVTVTR